MHNLPAGRLLIGAQYPPKGKSPPKLDVGAEQHMFGPQLVAALQAIFPPLIVFCSFLLNC